MKELNSIVKLLNHISNKLDRFVSDIESDSNIFDCVFGELGDAESEGKYYIKINEGTTLYNYIFDYFVKLSGGRDKSQFINYIDRVVGNKVFLNYVNDEYDEYSIRTIDFNSTNIIIRPNEASIRYYNKGTEIKLVKWPNLD